MGGKSVVYIGTCRIWQSDERICTSGCSTARQLWLNAKEHDGYLQ